MKDPDPVAVARVSGRRSGTIATCGLALTTLLALGGCGADAQSATAPDGNSADSPSSAQSGSLLTVDKPPPSQSPPAELVADVTTPPAPQLSPPPEDAVLQAAPGDCATAVRIHDNKHNICATWTNDAPNFLAPKQLFTGPLNFSFDSIDANGDTAHHINKYPAPWFGASTWAATSAATGYGASMNWVVSSNEPGDTISGVATQDKDNDHTQPCNGVEQYVACLVTRAEMSAIDGNRVFNVTYDLVNAPLTVEVINNTGKPMTLTAAPALSNIKASGKGTAGTASIAPSAQGTPAKSAIFGSYRHTGGQAASLKAVYSFPDATNGDVTHMVTVAIEMVPNKSADPRSWTVDTSRSSCTDNPIGGSSPATAQCTVGWSGNLSWFASAAATVNVYNKS
ncbi:MAG: hypothetical protein ACH36H_02105 [Candidatus Nanopelagicales bacterium]